MALEGLKETILGRLDSVPDSFLSLVDQQNEVLWKELLKLLDGLDVENGVILNTSKNLALSGEITERLKQVMFNGDYYEGLKSYVGAFDEQSTLLNSLYSQQF